MKFDILKWQEVTTNETYDAPKGRLHIMCSKESAVYVSAHGVEVLAGVGKEIDITTSEELTFIVEAPEGTRVFVETPRAVYHKSETERFTNDDRRPLESESVLVKRALRQFQIEQSKMIAQMRQAAKKYKPAEKHEATENEVLNNEEDEPPASE